MTNIKCAECHNDIMDEIYESDGFTGGIIKTYCLNCFYERVKVGFNQMNLICKCGKPLVMGEGLDAKEFEANFGFDTIEYLCPEIHDCSKYDWDFPTQIERNALKKHTRILIDSCRPKTGIEIMREQLEGYYEYQKDNIFIKVIKEGRVRSFDSVDLQGALELLELEREYAIRKAVINELFELEQKGEIDFLKNENDYSKYDYYEEFIKDSNEFQELIQSCSIEINRKFTIDKLELENEYK